MFGLDLMETRLYLHYVSHKFIVLKRLMVTIILDNDKTVLFVISNGYLFIMAYVSSDNHNR